MNHRLSDGDIDAESPSPSTDTSSRKHSDPTTGKDPVMTDQTKDEHQESSGQEPSTRKPSTEASQRADKAGSSEPREPETPDSTTETSGASKASETSADEQGASGHPTPAQAEDGESSDESQDDGQASEGSPKKKDAPSVSFTIVFEDDDQTDDSVVDDNMADETGAEETVSGKVNGGSEDDDTAQGTESPETQAPSTQTQRTPAQRRPVQSTPVQSTQTTSRTAQHDAEPGSASPSHDGDPDRAHDEQAAVASDRGDDLVNAEQQASVSTRSDDEPHRPSDTRPSDGVHPAQPEHVAASAEDSSAVAPLQGPTERTSTQDSKDSKNSNASPADPLMKVSSRINAEIHRRSSLKIDQYPVLSLNKVTYFPKKSRYAILDNVDWPFYSGSLQAVLTDADDARMAVAGLLTGLILPTSGSVEFRGKNLSEMEASEYRGHLVGVMLQRFASRDELSALENLVLTMEASGRNFLKPIPVIAKEWLARVDFPEDRADDPVHTLKTLDRRRAEIARTMCCDANVLILDEPSGDLEHPDAVTVMKLLTRLAQDKERCIVVLTSQDDVAQYGETIYEA